MRRRVSSIESIGGPVPFNVGMRDGDYPSEGVPAPCSDLVSSDGPILTGEEGQAGKPILSLRQSRLDTTVSWRPSANWTRTHRRYPVRRMGKEGILQRGTRHQ